MEGEWRFQSSRFLTCFQLATPRVFEIAGMPADWAGDAAQLKGGGTEGAAGKQVFSAELAWEFNGLEVLLIPQESISHIRLVKSPLKVF